MNCSMQTGGNIRITDLLMPGRLSDTIKHEWVSSLYLVRDRSLILIIWRGGGGGGGYTMGREGGVGQVKFYPYIKGGRKVLTMSMGGGRGTTSFGVPFTQYS